MTALNLRAKNETDPTVTPALEWAMNRLRKASLAGYDTLTEAMRFLGILKAIDNLDSDQESELLDRIQYNTRMDAIKKQLDGSTLFAKKLDDEIPVSRQRSTTNQAVILYTPPQAPTTADISGPLRVLATALIPMQRHQALMTLLEARNSAAMPHTAQTHVEDVDAHVREEAGHVTRNLYWNALLWTMHQDGSIDREIERRAKEMGKLAPNQHLAQKSGTTEPESTPEEIADALRRAQAAKRKRRRP